MSVVPLSLLLNSELIQEAVLVNFTLFLRFPHFENFEREIYYLLLHEFLYPKIWIKLLE